MKARVSSARIPRKVDSGKIDYKFIQPNRHGEYNGTIEKTVQTVRQVARCGLKLANLPSKKLWHYAVFYAIHVFNRIPHSAIGNQSLYAVNFFKPTNITIYASSEV